jgi:hypothetical protein
MKPGTPLIISGLIILLWASFMDTTVNTGFGAMHNVGLLQQRTHTLLLGGILLIAGLVLQGKSKRNSIGRSRRAKIKRSVNGVSFRDESKIQYSKPKEEWSNFIPRDCLTLRLTTGLASGMLAFILVNFAGVIIAGSTDSYINVLLFLLGCVIFVGSFLVSFRRRNAQSAVLPNIVAIVVIFAVVWIALLVSVFLNSLLSEIQVPVMGAIVFVCVLPLLAPHFISRRYIRVQPYMYWKWFLISMMASIFLVFSIFVGLSSVLSHL